MDSKKGARLKADKRFLKEDVEKEEKNLQLFNFAQQIQMLSSKGRLNKRGFELVYREGKAISQGNITVKLLKNDIKKGRFGVSVGLKFSPKAVERNKMKREIRAFWLKNKQKIHPGWDIVVIVRKNETFLGQETKETEVLQKILKKAALINQ